MIIFFKNQESILKLLKFSINLSGLKEQIDLLDSIVDRVVYKKVCKSQVYIINEKYSFWVFFLILMTRLSLLKLKESH